MNPNRAAICVEQTQKQIIDRLGKLVAVAVEAHLRPAMIEQAAKEKDIVTRVEAALASCPEWESVAMMLRPWTERRVYIVPNQTQNIRDSGYTFAHPPLSKDMNSVRVCEADGTINDDGTTTTWIKVEEIKNVTLLYSAAQNLLPEWLSQFHRESWTESDLSRVCAISPNFRACLVNTGQRFPSVPPAKITVFKHGPRGLTFDPMPEMLSRALQVAANLPPTETP